MLVSINGTDITNYIQESTYVINQEEVTEDFYDGNYKLHKILMRKRIAGSFQIVFVKSQDLASFLNLIEANKTDNLVRITVWVTNLNAAKEIDAYITISSKKKRKISSKYEFILFDVNVEEA